MLWYISVVSEIELFQADKGKITTHNILFWAASDSNILNKMLKNVFNRTVLCVVNRPRQHFISILLYHIIFSEIYWESKAVNK